MRRNSSGLMLSMKAPAAESVRKKAMPMMAASTHISILLSSCSYRFAVQKCASHKSGVVALTACDVAAGNKLADAVSLISSLIVFHEYFKNMNAVCIDCRFCFRQGIVPLLH